MRLVDWNIEHMNSWFVPNSDPTSPALRENYTGGGFGGGSISDVPALTERVSNILEALDPDVICIQEGAGEDEVALVLNQLLPLPDGNEWSILGGSGGSQKLIIAARTDREVTSLELAEDRLTLGLNAPYVADTDGDGVSEADTTFTRVPLVADVTAHGQAVRIINCHLKSKFVANGDRLFRGTEAEQREFIRASLRNRRRISAEAFRIRTYLDDMFSEDSNRLILLTGDLNDGPGFDFFERQFLTHNLVDLIFGSILQPDGRLSHPLIQTGRPRPASAFFDDFIDGIDNKPLLLDHIGLSSALTEWLVIARVADEEFNTEIRSNVSNERERLPSDHRPLFAELVP